MSNVHVDLGDDWVEFKDPELLTSREHRRVMQAMSTGNAAGGFMSVGLAIRDAVIINCVQAWSFQDAVPRDLAALDKLRIPLKPYRRLMDAVDDYSKPFRMVDVDDDADPTGKPSDD